MLFTRREKLGRKKSIMEFLHNKELLLNNSWAKSSTSNISLDPTKNPINSVCIIIFIVGKTKLCLWAISQPYMPLFLRINNCSLWILSGETLFGCILFRHPVRIKFMCQLHCEMRCQDLRSNTNSGGIWKGILGGEEHGLSRRSQEISPHQCGRASSYPVGAWWNKGYCSPSLLGHEYWSFWLLNLETLGHTQVGPLFSGLLPWPSLPLLFKLKIRSELNRSFFLVL